MNKTCNNCRHATPYTLKHDPVLLCSAPALPRDPVTGEVVVGARYCRNDEALCGREGTWHEAKLTPPRGTSLLSWVPIAGWGAAA